MTTKLSTLSVTGKENLYLHQTAKIKHTIAYLTGALNEAQNGNYSDMQTMTHMITSKIDLVTALADINDLANSMYTADLRYGKRRKGERRNHNNPNPNPIDERRVTITGQSGRRYDASHYGI